MAKGGDTVQGHRAASLRTCFTKCFIVHIGPKLQACFRLIVSCMIWSKVVTVRALAS